MLRRTSGVIEPLKPPFLRRLSIVWILSHPEIKINNGKKVVKPGRTPKLTLLPGDFWQVCRGLLGPTLVVELDPDPVGADVPVEEVGGVLEPAEDRHAAVQPRQLLP